MNGRSEQEQIDRIETKVDRILRQQTDHRLYTEGQLGRRPTRAELIGWVTVLGGLAIGVLNMLA